MACFFSKKEAGASLLLSVMGAFAEFERALIHERQREGITLAKQRGAYKGRKKALSAAASCSCARGLRPTSARPKSPASLASAGKPSTSICRAVRLPHSHGTPAAAHALRLKIYSLVLPLEMPLDSEEIDL